MDINTIITHLKNFSDTWNGWNGVITGLYRFNPFIISENDKQLIGTTPEKGWGNNVETAKANIDKLFPNK